MSRYQVVIDTNVFIAALQSHRGASFKLLMLVGSTKKFEISVSVPLVLEYEDVAKRLLGQIPMGEQDIDDIIDYLCRVGHHKKIYYLWRPLLKDPKDDRVLELAITASCDFIITFNTRDFQGIEPFGIRVVTPQEFLREIGELQ